MSKRRRFRPLPIAALVLAATLTSPAPAATQTRYIIQLAPGICGANNPTNDANLRRMGYGLRNTGTTTVSVVCTMWGDDGTATGVGLVRLFFTNHKPTGSKMTCSLSMGLPVSGGQATTTKSLEMGGYALNNLLEWSAADYGSSQDAQWVTLQCSLPPGVSMAEIMLNYDENVGA